MVEKKVVKKAVAETTEAVAKPTAKAAAPKEAKEKKERKIGLRNFKDDQVITLLVDHNPKRPGSASHARFENYEDGMTVKEALTAGLISGDLSWDVAHEFIEIGAEFNEDAVKKSKAVKEPKPKKEKAAKEGAAPAPTKKKVKPVVEEADEADEADEE